MTRGKIVPKVTWQFFTFVELFCTWKSWVSYLKDIVLQLKICFFANHTKFVNRWERVKHVLPCLRNTFCLACETRLAHLRGFGRILTPYSRIARSLSLSASFWRKRELIHSVHNYFIVMVHCWTLEYYYFALFRLFKCSICAQFHTFYYNFALFRTEC